ncbi:SusC/RagA family TonB-linked outer membrane protein [Flavobacterium sp.]|uniref:SusC/RagA family TonB-linked outer membrane protein n=1 Tax=Flavobacterium sp. TaxID=239 RepID=UPI0031E10A63
MNYFSFYKDGKALYCLFLLGFSLSFSSLYAGNPIRSKSNHYQQQIKGTVTDGSGPLPGVTISVKNKSGVAAITDYSGQYVLNATATDTLQISFIGFKTSLVPVNGRTKIDIVLKYDTTTLQEVRVNAGYYSVKESERTGNIARITSKDIEAQPVANVLAVMQGRMAGVSVTQSTGVPGGGFDIKIRGQNSLRSDANSPLYIIDGVPFSSEAVGSYLTNTTFPSPVSPLSSINPDTIESIEVLKDADATAIYGSRGANGVVLITTKKGRTGKTEFNITASTGFGKVTRFLKLMNTQDYLAMRKQAFINDGVAYNSWDYDVNGTWDQNRYTDWQKELLGGTAMINNLQGTVSGGSSNTQFLFGGNYYSESTVFPGNFLYKKGGVQASVNHKSEDQKFRINFSAVYNSQNNDQPSYDFTYDARSLPPNAPALYDSLGNLNWENNTFDNPLRNLNTKMEAVTNDLTASTLLSYEIFRNLNIKSSFGFTDFSSRETRVIPSTTINPAYNPTSANSSIFVNDTDRRSWIIEPQLNWSTDTGLGKIELLLGSTFQSQTTERFQQSGTGFSSNSLIYNLAAAKTVRMLLDDEALYKYQAFFARFNYNWEQRYIVNLTARRDGSSRFGPGKQFANFGAIGAAWLFSNEHFLKDNSWLSFGKLRASYGTTGNDQIGDYQFLDTYTTSGVLYNGVVGLRPSRLFNEDFGWETNKKFEVAVELGFLQDKIFLTAAWYQNRSSNQLVGLSIPGTTGFTALQANLDATVENSGFEFTLRTTNFKTKYFSWITSLNYTASRNRLISFPGLESSSYSQMYRIGKPLNIALLYQLNGVNPQTGLYEFEDINNDGAISFPEDRQKTADLNPQYYGGLQNQLVYKRFSLDFLFQFVKQKNRTYPMGPAGMMSNQQQRINDSWINSGDITQYQLYTTGLNNDALTGDYHYTDSNASIVDASFIRLKNISLIYDLPLNLKESRIRLILQGQNLLTFTKYPDGDPEFTAYGFLPPLRVISAGIQLTF